MLKGLQWVNGGLPIVVVGMKMEELALAVLTSEGASNSQFAKRRSGLSFTIHRHSRSIVQAIHCRPDAHQDNHDGS